MDFYGISGGVLWHLRWTSTASQWSSTVSQMDFCGLSVGLLRHVWWTQVDPRGILSGVGRHLRCSSSATRVDVGFHGISCGLRWTSSDSGGLIWHLRQTPMAWQVAFYGILDNGGLGTKGSTENTWVFHYFGLLERLRSRLGSMETGHSNAKLHDEYFFFTFLPVICTSSYLYYTLASICFIINGYRQLQGQVLLANRDQRNMYVKQEKQREDYIIGRMQRERNRKVAIADHRKVSQAKMLRKLKDSAQVQSQQQSVDDWLIMVI
uniref:Uncharacterized protein n=1 Tax=Ditylenchus dipsaci TaxID=166011 RepID=A0A915DEI8_9BILA